MTVRRGSVIEVRTHTRWSVAIVDKVAPHTMSASVTMLASKRSQWISLSSQTWRHLGREGKTDVQRVMRTLLSHGPAEFDDDLKVHVKRPRSSPSLV